MFQPNDTKHVPAVAAFTRKRFEEMFPEGNWDWIQQVFGDFEAYFTGKNPDYLAIDLHYHDLEHTLQATYCLVELLANRHRIGAEPRLNIRNFELAVAAALFHDSGYLKLRSDQSGTGAKYTFVHVIRSCAFAGTYLPTRGATEYETEGILSAIATTGPANEIGRLYFRDRTQRVIGCALATADYLSQMAAPNYPDELGILYREFEESYEYFHTPPSARPFRSVEELVRKTPKFWHQVVKQKLEKDFQGIYRFLAVPYPDGPNPYIDAIEANIAKIAQRVKSD